MRTMRSHDGVSRPEGWERGVVPTSLTLALPDAVADVLGRPAATTSTEDRMGLVLDLAAANVAGGGGPFAAAVFAMSSGQLLAGGVNLVVPAAVPVAHAEIVAFALAGQRLGTFDLATHGPVELVTSCEPCAMCLGALPWGGISRLVSAARDEDARAIGFDEGDKSPSWVDALRRRGIEVLVDIRRQDAIDMMQGYVRAGGLIYNGQGLK